MGAERMRAAPPPDSIEATHVDTLIKAHPEEERFAVSGPKRRVLGCRDEESGRACLLPRGAPARVGLDPAPILHTRRLPRSEACAHGSALASSQDPVDVPAGAGGGRAAQEGTLRSLWRLSKSWRRDEKRLSRDALYGLAYEVSCVYTADGCPVPNLTFFTPVLLGTDARGTSSQGTAERPARGREKGRHGGPRRGVHAKRWTGTGIPHKHHAWAARRGWPHPKGWALSGVFGKALIARYRSQSSCRHARDHSPTLKFKTSRELQIYWGLEPLNSWICISQLLPGKVVLGVNSLVNSNQSTGKRKATAKCRGQLKLLGQPCWPWRLRPSR